MKIIYSIKKLWSFRSGKKYLDASLYDNPPSLWGRIMVLVLFNAEVILDPSYYLDYVKKTETPEGFYNNMNWPHRKIHDFIDRMYPYLWEGGG